MENNIKKYNTILDMKKVYIDVSSIKNANFKKCIENMDIIICLSELTILEIKNEKVYNGLPNEDFINGLMQNAIVLKVNNNILAFAKYLIDNFIIPKEQYNDALHIAIAKYYRCYTILYDKEVFENKNLKIENI